jgi:ribosome-binding factor A
MSVRAEKVSEEIKHKLPGVLSKDLMGLNLGLVTVTKVETTKDLRTSKIFISFLGNKETADKCLEKVAARMKQIRMHLSAELYLRYMPELLFYHDDSSEYASKIEELIKQIHKDDPDKEVTDKID